MLLFPHFRWNRKIFTKKLYQRWFVDNNGCRRHLQSWWRSREIAIIPSLAGLGIFLCFFIHVLIHNFHNFLQYIYTFDAFFLHTKCALLFYHFYQVFWHFCKLSTELSTLSTIFLLLMVDKCPYFLFFHSVLLYVHQI